VTVDYQDTTGSPVTYSGDQNIFRLSFDLITPITINLSASTVTYSANAPGSDFTDAGFTCTTINVIPANQCGSANPAEGVSFNYSVPEPPTWMALILGTGLIGFARRRRRKLVVACPAISG
jgi:hypothetical protein